MPDHNGPHDWPADVRARLAAAKLHPQDEADIVDEVAQHLEAQFADLAPRIGAQAARTRLVAELNDGQFDDAVAGRRRRARPTQARVWSSSSVLRDVRYGLRSLRRSPGMVAAGVAALALGIGLTTVMFSVIYGLLIKGLPFDDPSRIATIYRTDPTGHGEEDLVPFADFTRYRVQQRSFSAFGGYALGSASMSGGDRPERVELARVSSGMLDVTNVRPILGRLFTPADNAADAPPTAVIGYAIWRDRFAGDSAIIGQAIRVSGRFYSIVGVMPDGFQFPRSQQVWLPLQIDPVALLPGDGTPLTIVARLAGGASYASANAELAGLSRRLASEHADTTAVRDLAQPFVRATIPLRVYSLLYAMLGAVFLVLLVACANVANLLLDRAANRTREIGIRIALGASRLAVVRQSLVESTILAMLAAVVGTALAEAGIVAFNRAMVRVGEMPFWMDIRLHWPVLVFVLGVATVASVVSGLLPAVHSSRIDINTILKDESHAASSLRVGRLSRAIVVAEIALSTMMLVTAGFLTKSIIQLRAVSPRFESSNVFTARVSLPPADTLRQRQFFERLEHDLAATSTLDAAFLGNGLPGTGWHGDAIAVDGRTYARRRDYPSTRWLAVNPGFFATFSVALLEGRAISETDRLGAPAVAVVSDAFVRREFRGESAIGRRIRVGAPWNGGEWLTIVGVMPSLYAASVVSANGNHFPPEVLTAFWQQPQIASASVALRGPSGAANAATLRTIVTALDPDVPVYAPATMDDVLARPAWPLRVFGTMFIIFGVVSLVLASIGLYAVMSFSVSRRVREMGIRMALGATSGSVIRLVCRQGAVQIVLGMSIGLVAGAGAVRVANAALYEVHPGDPAVFALVTGVLSLAAFVACIIPAVAATRVDPVVALRTD